MPTMEELLNQISVEITRNQTVLLLISKIDQENRYGQMKIPDEKSQQCVFAIIGGTFSGYHRFKKGFYGLVGLPTVFHKKLNRTLGDSTPAWLDDVIVVTRESKQDHEKNYSTS